MISRYTIALSVAVLGAGLLPPSTPAQGRGMHGPAATPHARSSFRLSGREGFGRSSDRRFLNEPTFFFPYYYSDGDYDYGTEVPEALPAQMTFAQPARPAPVPAPVAAPVEPLLLENHDGQWVRVPTGSEMQPIAQTTKPDSPKASTSHPGMVELTEPGQPLPELPPAVLVFRDGHREEMGKYMIQGGILYTNTEDWNTGTWTKKIPLADLDIPASLKLNKERGTKFNLPSGPNEVVVRF